MTNETYFAPKGHDLNLFDWLQEYAAAIKPIRSGPRKGLIPLFDRDEHTHVHVFDGKATIWAGASYGGNATGWVTVTRLEPSPAGTGRTEVSLHGEYDAETVYVLGRLLDKFKFSARRLDLITILNHLNVGARGDYPYLDGRHYLVGKLPVNYGDTLTLIFYDDDHIEVTRPVQCLKITPNKATREAYQHTLDEAQNVLTATLQLRHPDVGTNSETLYRHIDKVAMLYYLSFAEKPELEPIKSLDLLALGLMEPNEQLAEIARIVVTMDCTPARVLPRLSNMLPYDRDLWNHYEVNAHAAVFGLEDGDFLPLMS